MTTAEYEHELENLTKDVLFHTKRFNELLDAVRDIEQAKTCQILWTRLQGLIRSYDYQDPEDWHAGLAEQAPEPEQIPDTLICDFCERIMGPGDDQQTQQPGTPYCGDCWNARDDNGAYLNETPDDPNEGQPAYAR